MVTRREFIGSVSAAAVVTQLKPESQVLGETDPLGVRGDFPVVEEVAYLDSAYIAPSPTPTSGTPWGWLTACTTGSAPRGTPC